MESGIILVVFSVFGSFVFAFFFFSEWLFREREVQTKAVQILFSVTFSLSSFLFYLIIFEIMDVLNQETRWVLWRIDFVLLSLLVTVILPAIVIHNVAKSMFFDPVRALACTSLGLFGFWYLFWRIGDAIPMSSHPTQITSLWFNIYNDQGGWKERKIHDYDQWHFEVVKQQQQQKRLFLSHSPVFPHLEIFWFTPKLCFFQSNALVGWELWV